MAELGDRCETLQYEIWVCLAVKTFQRRKGLAVFHRILFQRSPESLQLSFEDLVGVASNDAATIVVNLFAKIQMVTTVLQTQLHFATKGFRQGF